MSADLVQIVLVGGPLDGYAHSIAAAEAGRTTRTCVPPRALSVAAAWLPEDTIPEMLKNLHYRPLLAEFAGLLAPSITDDGAMRYEYVGEW